MKKIEEIINLLKSNDLEGGVDFFFHKTKPTIQKDGIKYEVLSIFPDENTIRVSAIPCYSWCLKELEVDSSWNQKTLDKITRLVESEIHRTQESY